MSCRSNSSGQAALILIMIMAVIGALSVSLASRSVENLRSSEIQNTSSQSFKAAEAALELALSTKANVPSTPLGSGSFSATYTQTGTNGFVSDLVDEGDVVQASLVGASGAGANTVNIYWNSNLATKTAIMVSVLNNTGVNYSVTYYTAEPDNIRSVSSNLDTTVSSPIPFTTGNFTFQGVGFGNKLAIPINLASAIAPKLIRIKILYQGSSIGVEPVGITLASQAVTVNATGTAGGNVNTNLLLSKFSDRVPVVFDNVLYTNGSLSQ